MSMASLDAAQAGTPAAKGRRRLWLVPVLALFAIQCGEIFRLHGALFASMVDNDTLMRLARIRYVLETHGWHGGFFPRDNAPYGMVLHWSLLFDLPILALAGLFSIFVPFATALSLAGAFTGPLLAYAVVGAAWWMGAPILSRRGREFACLAVALCPTLLGYGEVGRANHHIALALMMVILAGLTIRIWRAPRPIRPGILGGVAAGLSTWLSFELVALGVAPTLLVLALLWVRDGGRRLNQNLAFAAAFAIVETAALLIDPPYGGVAAFALDRLSLPYVAFAWLVAAMWGLMAVGARLGLLRSSGARLAAGLLLGLAAAGGLVALYPAILAGVNGQIDPVIQAELNAKVSETQPATIGVVQFLQSAYAGCLGAAAGLYLLWRHWRRGDRLGWAIVATAILALAGLGVAHIRFSPYAAIGGAFLLAALIETIEGTAGAALARQARTLGLAIAIAVPFFAIYLPKGNNGGADAAADADPAKGCSIHAVRGALSDPAWFGVASGIVATDVDSAPATLYWTPHRTLFGPYHRNGQGLRDLLALFRDTGDQDARAIARARGIDAVLVCAAHPQDMFMSKDGGKAAAGAKTDDTLFRRLVEGRPPAWLAARPWPQGVKTGYVLYAVDRGRLAGGQ